MKPTRLDELKLWNSGCAKVVGIDEVGRGALAGPVVAAAVILPGKCKLPGVKDSKLLTAPQRQSANELIKKQALAVGLGWVSHDEVDLHGLTWAVKQSAQRALGDMGAAFDAIILDGNHNYFVHDYNSTAIIKADQRSLCVAAASIVAKVARDNYMMLVDQVYPEYQFASNKGYGTALHRQKLAKGLSPIHRASWQISFNEYVQAGVNYVD
jgi:ribonuclease HII